MQETRTIRIHSEDYVPAPADGEEDRVLAFLTDDTTYLYRDVQSGNRIPTEQVIQLLSRREVEAHAPLGAVQAFAGGVPEILVTGEQAGDDERVLFLAGLLKTRGVVPEGTPVFALRDGRQVEVFEAPAFRF